MHLLNNTHTIEQQHNLRYHIRQVPLVCIIIQEQFPVHNSYLSFPINSQNAQVYDNF